jgi:autotransporter-associated beta strand protein
MKTNLSFLRNTTRIFFLVTVTLLLLSARSTAFAGSAAWNDTGGDWNTDSDWTPTTGFPNGAADTATFNLANTFTAVGISANTEVAEIIFSSLATKAFTITVSPTHTLMISGTGITNNSGITQNFVTAVDGAGERGVISFTNSATAGSMTAITNNGATVSGEGGGFTDFLDTSTAGSATITNNGGTVSGAAGGFTQFFNISTAGSATLIANGGTVAGASGGFIVFFTDSTGGTASVDVRNNGSGTAGNLDISFHNAPGVTIGSLEGSGNVFLGANNLTVGSNNLSKTFSGVMQDGGQFGGTGGSLTKIGTGTLTLTGANTYTGATTVNAGTLLVNGSTSSSSAVTVNNSGTTLGGTGTIGGGVTVNSGANLSPGNSPGILNTGSVTLTSGSNLLIDINGTTVGTQYDRLNVTGTVNLGGSNLVITVGGTLTVNETFTIIESTGGVSGLFAQGSSVTGSNGDVFSIDYTSNDVVLTATSVAVPEPSTWVAGALMVAFVAYTQRRRFAQMLRRA